MEDPCLVMSSTTNFFENFLDQKKICGDLRDLPILGTSALEQFLEQEQQRIRMSPDSTMNPAGIPESRNNPGSPDQSPSDQIPDSTTSDLTYDSDAFDSESSNQSFPDMIPSTSENSVTSFANVNFLMVPNTKDEESSSNSSFSFDLNQSQPQVNPHFQPNNPVKTKKNAKKSKKAGDTLLKCGLCDYTTRFKEHLSSHMQSHATTRNYLCTDCGQSFKWSHSLKRHQRTHSPTADFRYTCHFCYKTFSRKDHLSIHENLHTDSGTSFPCAECGATFKNKKTLAGHMKTHTSEKAFKCSQCDSEFTRKASLNRHVRAAHHGQVITCPFCPAVFSYRSTLEDHKKAAHNEGRREYGCDLCGVQFAVKAYLSKHMVTCRNRAVGRSFACELCSKNFPTKRHLHEHNKRKHPQVQPQVQPTQPQQPQQVPQQQYNNNIPYDNYYYHPMESFNVKSENTPKSPYPTTPHPAVMGHDLPLPQISNPVMEEDHNVGSLLRLVYSCPDQLESQEYSHTPIGQHTPHAGQPSQSNMTRSVVCQPAEPMIDYPPILDGITLDYL